MAGIGDIAGRLARGAQGRSEADIQADVRALLLATPLGLGEEDLEVRLEAYPDKGKK